MTLLLTVRSLINERLSAAAEDIFGAVERIVTEIYEDSKQNIEQQRRILDVVLNPQPKQQHRTDFLLLPIIKEVSSEQPERKPSLVHDVKPEQEERINSLVREEPLPVQEEPELVQEEEPEPLQEKEPEPLQKGPEPVQKEPEPLQKGPEPVQKEPEPLQKGPEPVQKEPEPLQKGPEPVQKEPEPLRKGPAPLQDEPEPVQKEPEPLQEEESEPPEVEEEQEELPQRPEEVLDGKANGDNLAGKGAITVTTRRIMDELDSVTVSSLKVAGIDEAFLRTLSREDVKDLFPEPEHFLRRRRLLALINSARSTIERQALVFNVAEMQNKDENPTVPDKAGPSETGRLSSSPSALSPICPRAQASSTPLEKKRSTKMTLQLPSPPEYVLYTDSELEQVRKHYHQMAADGREGECVMSKELRCRLVRNTVVSMISILRASQQGAQDGRYPSRQELNAMAKMIVEHYPMLQDKGNPTKHMSVFGYLSKRCQNVRPTVKKRGSTTPGRGRPKKRQHTDFSTSDTEPEVDDDVADTSGGSGSTAFSRQTSRSSDDSHGSSDKDSQMTLQEMFKKSNPDHDAVTQILDIEFEARRHFIDRFALKEEDRPIQILDRYPWFKELHQAMEELRRILDKDNSRFVEEVKKRWEDFFIDMQFYGVAKKVMKKPDVNDRALFRALPKLFPSPTAAPKKLGHASEALLHVLQPTEELAVYLQKRCLSTPVLVLDGSHCLVAVGSTPVATFATEDLGEGLLYLLAYYYTLNLTYPKCVETLLTVIQTEILQDPIHPADTTASYKRAMGEWSVYRAENSISVAAAVLQARLHR